MKKKVRLVMCGRSGGRGVDKRVPQPDELGGILRLGDNSGWVEETGCVSSSHAQFWYAHLEWSKNFNVRLTTFY